MIIYILVVSICRYRQRLGDSRIGKKGCSSRESNPVLSDPSTPSLRAGSSGWESTNPNALTVTPEGPLSVGIDSGVFSICGMRDQLPPHRC